MFSLNKLLIPVAFSENCRGCARYAATLACHFKPEITLVHVLEPLGGALEFAGGTEEIERSRREWFSRELEAFFRTELFSLPVRRALLEGDPAIEIVKFASEQHIDLITMPTHGYGPFRRLLMGSVTAKVLHDASCPVWTGVHWEKAFIPDRITFRTIACAVDLGPQTHTALRWAAGMAAAWSSRLVAVHAIAECPDTASQDVRSAIAREALNRTVGELGIVAEVQIEFGDAPGAIRRALEHIQASLLVISRGHAARGGRLPSTAYAILRESPCPVVSV